MPAPKKIDFFAVGLSDALGFLGGSLAGYWLGKLLGLDIFSPGYGGSSIGGILLVGLGGGLGLQVARRWQVSRKDKE
jgi:membrane protein YqaA with SNARE-associated domain